MPRAKKYAELVVLRARPRLRIEESSAGHECPSVVRGILDTGRIAWNRGSPPPTQSTRPELALRSPLQHPANLLNGRRVVAADASAACPTADNGRWRGRSSVGIWRDHTVRVGKHGGLKSRDAVQHVERGAS